MLLKEKEWQVLTEEHWLEQQRHLVVGFVIMKLIN